MKTLHIKKPSAPGRGHLGSQMYGKQFSKQRYINSTAVMDRHRREVALPLPGRNSCVKQ